MSPRTQARLFANAANVDSPSAVAEARTVGRSLALALAAAVLSAGAMMALPYLAPSAEIVAVTADGNAYVAGSGSGCAEAWRNAVLPADWTRLACEAR